MFAQELASFLVVDVLSVTFCYVHTNSFIWNLSLLFAGVVKIYLLNIKTNKLFSGL